MENQSSRKSTLQQLADAIKPMADEARDTLNRDDRSKLVAGCIGIIATRFDVSFEEWYKYFIILFSNDLTKMGEEE